MLVDSPRLSDADRDAWAIMEAGDIRRSRSGRVDYLAAESAQHVREFIAAGCAYVSVSWGKDSVVVAHLARSVAPGLYLVHGEFPGHENPDSAAVADEFLGGWPMPYSEIECQWTDPTTRHVQTDRWARPMRDAHGPRRIMGIRAQESGTRKMSAGVHGIATSNVCRPILNWSTLDVFAYLARHDLPVHPAYAMSRGGTIDRESLRVDVIGDVHGAERGRADWERHYYPDVG